MRENAESAAHATGHTPLSYEDEFDEAVDAAIQWNNELEDIPENDDGEPMPPLNESSDEETNGNNGEYEYRGPRDADPKFREKRTPDQKHFEDRLPFIQAVVKRGKPKRGNAISGYCFRTGFLGTGYYRDTPEDRARWQQEDQKAATKDFKHKEIPMPSKLRDTKPEDAVQTPSTATNSDDDRAYPEWLTKRSRRRHEAGKRVRGYRRPKTKEQSKTWLSSTTLMCKWARDNGILAIDSWNGNTWHSCADRAFKSSADALMTQETKIKDQESCDRAEDAAGRNGWKATFRPANNTAKGGVSAGVGILAKKHVGLRSYPETIGKQFRPRISHAWLGTGRKGGLHVFSVYLWTAEGLSQRNKDLLGEIERVTKTLRGPWIVEETSTSAPKKSRTGRLATGPTSTAQSTTHAISGV